jgi:hypothetical protein
MSSLPADAYDGGKWKRPLSLQGCSVSARRRMIVEIHHREVHRRESRWYSTQGHLVMSVKKSGDHAVPRRGNGTPVGREPLLGNLTLPSLGRSVANARSLRGVRSCSMKGRPGFLAAWQSDTGVSPSHCLQTTDVRVITSTYLGVDAVHARIK